MADKKKNRRSAVSGVLQTPIIEIRHCSIVFEGKRVVDDVSFDLRNGDRWALIGPNGAGKTLFLKLLRGDMWPTPSGRERRVYRFDGEENDGPIGAKERISYVGPERQDRYVRYDWNHRVAQVVATGLFDEEIPRSRPTARQAEQVNRLLRQFGLWSLRRRGFLTLSYGQRRRALVARALAGSPQVLLLDEVFNGLDRSSASILGSALKRTRGTGSTWIVTTHRAADVPTNATHAARMHRGRLTIVSMVGGSSNRRAANRKTIQSMEPPIRPKSTEAKGDEALIRLSDVDLYRDYRLVLSDVDWTVLRGEHWAVTGRNGSGKSTLLKLLYGDLHPKLGGTVERAGVPVGTPISEWKSRIGFVSPELQADYFLARDLEEVVISGRYSSIGLNDTASRKDHADARHWLKFFGIADLGKRKPRAVSYGQMRLSLLARAMMNDPKLLLLDEPVTGLDVDTRAQVLDLLESLAKRGVQLIMAVHERSDLPQCVGNVLRIRRDKRVEIATR